MAEFVEFNSFASFVRAATTNERSAEYYKCMSLGVYLTNDKPDLLQHTKKKDLAEIPHGGGYNGSVILDITHRHFVDEDRPLMRYCSITDSIVYFNVYSIGAKDIKWTGFDSGFGPFQYVVLFDATNNIEEGEQDLIGVWSYSSSQNVEAKHSIVWAFMYVLKFLFPCLPPRGKSILASIA